ncbi:hypothetical protein NDU88_006180 [Pleurodeles waltl]|uniref:Uncharacterized protein n=1 Tax=Pleurodeles waltl TaxID=8319 RepID=A0AAV7RN41_PLEWA|nr:hypothetical protein NDU88_006180 [Pleurodeles waltl]
MCPVLRTSDTCGCNVLCALEALFIASSAFRTLLPPSALTNERQIEDAAYFKRNTEAPDEEDKKVKVDPAFAKLQLEHEDVPEKFDDLKN